MLTRLHEVSLLFGNTAFQSNMPEQTKKPAFPRKGKDATCLVSLVSSCRFWTAGFGFPTAHIT